MRARCARWPPLALRCTCWWGYKRSMINADEYLQPRSSFPFTAATLDCNQAARRKHTSTLVNSNFLLAQQWRASWNKGIWELTARMLEKHKISAPASKCAAGREVAHLWIIIRRRRRRIIRKEGGGGERASEENNWSGADGHLHQAFPLLLGSSSRDRGLVWSGTDVRSLAHRELHFVMKRSRLFVLAARGALFAQNRAWANIVGGWYAAGLG